MLKYTDYRREEKVADRFLYLLPLQGLKGRILVRLCALSQIASSSITRFFSLSPLPCLSVSLPFTLPSAPHHSFHVLKALPWNSFQRRGDMLKISGQRVACQAAV